MLIVSTDRISAFDWILPTLIPDKGRVLTAISAFWFDLFSRGSDPVPHHLITTDVDDMDLPAGIDRGHDELAGEAHRKGEKIEARDADHRHGECVGDGHRRRDAHAQTGEQPRAEIHGNHADLTQLDARLAAHEIDLGREDLRVALRPRRMRGRQHALVPTDGAPDLRRRAFDAEHQHQLPPWRGPHHWSIAAVNARVRADQRLPTGTRVISRSSSVAPKAMRISR